MNVNECYICFELCNEKCKCKCNLYVHENCIKEYGNIKNFYCNKNENVYFINCPICNDTTIYEFNEFNKKNKKIKRKKFCNCL